MLSVCLVLRRQVFQEIFITAISMSMCRYKVQGLFCNFLTLPSVGEQNKTREDCKRDCLIRALSFSLGEALTPFSMRCGILCQFTSSKAFTKSSWNGRGKEGISWNGLLKAASTLMDYGKIADTWIVSVKSNGAFFDYFAFPRRSCRCHTRRYEMREIRAWYFCLACDIFFALFM